MGSLPELNMICEWLPVDTLAECLTELVLPTQSESIGHMSSPGGSAQLLKNGDVGSSQAPAVYSLLSPHSFSWTSDLPPALSSPGIAFQPISLAAWTNKLDTLASARSGADPVADPEQNPAVKLVQCFKSSLEGLEDAEDGVDEEKRVVFEIEGAKSHSPALRETPKIVESGLLKKMVVRWMEKRERVIEE